MKLWTDLTRGSPKGLLFLVFLLLFMRLLLNMCVPLMDNTEARYAEIARIMAQTRNWITPQVDYGVPFWAKPPLSTWLSAGSFKFFGINEFAARLPYFLISVFMILLTGKYASRKNLPFLLPGLVLLTTPQFFLHAGVVSTDTALALSITIVMLSFWEVMNQNNNWYWKYLFFVGIGIGLLAKGPIVGILTVPPLVVWLWIHKSFRIVSSLFPWVRGILITLIIALPWYLMAEIKSPGFIDYFVLGEHFKRFFVSDWIGDKYGVPKSQPLGMIWIFLFALALPWIQVIIYKLLNNGKSCIKDKWVSFLLLWILWTPLFFSVSKSLLHPYILPIMVPIALLVTSWWNEFRRRKVFLLIGVSISILMFSIVSLGLLLGTLKVHSNTDKYLIENIEEGFPLFHFDNKSYSSQFYSKGKIISIDEIDLENKISNQEHFRIIMNTKDTIKLSPIVLSQLKALDNNNKKTLFGNSYERK
ncbi:MAG: glycosyltransferase family 39 protein [Flavobacteriaceae bacterium]|nr:glycosyltransferase family 39 protein [Flavobacteriaceae bacterium]